MAETFHFRLGDLACIVLSDYSETVTEQYLARIFRKDADKLLPDFRALSAPLSTSLNLLLVETAGKRVLIDTGNGLNDPAEPGHLLANLRSENIAPESIDTIIITHYHVDHICGLLDSEGNPTFATARLVVPKLEHDYWMNETYLASIEQTRAQLLRKTFAAYAGRLTLLDQGVEIEPGLRYVPAFGHTPGHSAVSIESQDARLLHIADTLLSPLQLNVMDATPKFDNQPDLAIATRQAILHQAEAEKLMLLIYHFPFPGLGHIQHTGARLEWVPVPAADV